MTGSDAFNQIVASNSLGRAVLPFGTRDYLKEFSNNLQGGSGSPAGSDDSNHQDTEGNGFDPTKGGQSQARLYTAKEDITPEEAAIFDTKIQDLKNASIIGALSIPFKADAFSKLEGDAKLKATGTRGVDDLYYDLNSGLEKINGKHIYPCASLIEFLLLINSKIALKGDFDLGRDAMSAGGQGKSINDHSTGRGIDIRYVGTSMDTVVDLNTKNVPKNKTAFNLLLDTLAVMDESLLPDLIVFDDRLESEYGILSGAYEIDSSASSGVNGIIQKKYPMLKKIDFHANNGHQDHFHIAFSPQRAGSYIDYVDSTTAPNWGSSPSTGVSLQGLSKYPDLFASRFADTSAVKNVDELYQALIGFGGFSPEVSAIFVMIAQRESSISAAGFNGNIGTGDYSLGLWQINYYGNQNLINQDIDLYDLQKEQTSYFVSKQKIKTYKLLFKDYETLKINNINSAVAKMKQIYNEEKTRKSSQQNPVFVDGKKYADDRLFNAATQIGLLKSFVSRYKSRWKFTAWGEYKDGPEYGWITSLKFQTAVDVYVKNNPGKTKKDLQDFCAPMIKNMLGADVHKGKSVYTRWLEGEIFGA